MQFFSIVRVAVGEAWAQLSSTEEKLSKGQKKKEDISKALATSQVERWLRKFVAEDNSRGQFGFPAVMILVGILSFLWQNKV